MTNQFSWIAAIMALAVGAWFHGNPTQRWGNRVEGPSSRRLHETLIEHGDYLAEEIPNEIPLTEKSRCTVHRYHSASRQQTVIVSVITGPPGSVAVHTPDVCYVASGYKMLTAPRRETVEIPGLGSVRYFVADFEKPRSDGLIDRQRVRWCWTADGHWDAPDRARFAYLGVSDLAKIYIVTPLANDAHATKVPDSPTAQAFLMAALSQYHRLYKNLAIE